jgi:hypothetical protein
LSRSFLGGEPTEPTPTIEFKAFDFDSTDPTTDTASFDTAPELSEPAQHLYEALLRKPLDKGKQKQSTMATQSSSGTTTHSTTLIKLKDPKTFTGKREELGKFLQDTGLYIAVNDKIYDNDIKKITFVLSYIDEGDAAKWKEEFLESRAKASKGPVDLGTYDQFIADIKQAFQPFDGPGDALEQLKILRMGNNSAEDHVAQFKLLVTRADLTESAMLIDAFRETLKIPLQRQIMSLETAPKDLKGWYESAIKLDNKYRRIQRIIGRSTEQKSIDKEKKTEEPKRRWTFQQPRKDPNAMDVDVLTTEQREEHMKKGLCFKCHKSGHRSRECTEPGRTPPVKTPPAYSPRPTTSSSVPNKKMTPKEIYAQIRSLTTNMNDDEKEELDKLAEEEGF